jgi:hypothetical protein
MIRQPEPTQSKYDPKDWSGSAHSEQIALFGSQKPQDSRNGSRT